MTLAACSGDSGKQDSTALTSDSALAANLAMANADSAAKVQLGDTAPGATKAPSSSTTKPKPAAKPPVATPPRRPAATTRNTPKTNTPATTPTPAPAGPTTGTISAGTSLTLASSSKICTNTNAVGDHVTAVTTGSISGSNGAAIPAGATVNLTVTQLKRSENAKDPIVMEFRVNSVSWGGKTYSMDATVSDAEVERVRDQPKSKDVQKVAIGAAAGAIAGRILGKSTKGAVIGGAAGAAAGAATAAATANYQGCINQGSRIVVRLDAPLQVVVGT
jgi:hypothetical protein